MLNDDDGSESERRSFHFRNLSKLDFPMDAMMLRRIVYGGIGKRNYVENESGDGHGIKAKRYTDRPIKVHLGKK